MLCAKCNTSTDGLLWVGPYYYCWDHFYNATATERVRVGSLDLDRRRNDVY